MNREASIEQTLSLDTKHLKPAYDALQPIRAVPLIGGRARCRHIAAIFIGEINRGTPVIITAGTVVEGRVARSDLGEVPFRRLPMGSY